MEQFLFVLPSLLLVVRYAAGECIFPLQFQQQQWYYRVSLHSLTRTKIEVTSNSIRFVEQKLPRDSILNVYVLECEEMADANKFLFKRVKDGADVYKCIELIQRSDSVIQIRESAEIRERSSDSCRNENLKLQPWLVVSYPVMAGEFTPCPINAGFNMRIQDWQGRDHGCNFMDLPMRFESDCLAGEGVVFDFRKPDCTGFMSNNMVQKATCVTHWYHGNYLFVVVRKIESGNVWCIRFPRRFTTTTMEVKVYDDVICPDDDDEIKNNGIKFFTLFLEKVVHSDICADEYKKCSAMPCVPYIKDQCHKSCGICSADAPLPICSFPRRFRGEWYLSNSVGTEAVNISDHNVRIGSFGNFKCVSFSDSPPKSKRLYTTLSVFSNGCRPRYTCLDFKRLGPSAVGFAISQSLTWPINVKNPGQTICKPSHFRPDPEPVFDTYRSVSNSRKPILPVSRSYIPVACHLKSSYTFHAVISNAGSCKGRFYHDCKNSSFIRMEFDDCWLKDMTFACVASYKGRYWEKLILLQNIDDSFDSKCLGFTELNVNAAILLPSSQCDLNSWTYVDNGMREPNIRFRILPESVKCHDFPQPTTTMTTTTTTTTESVPLISEAFKMKSNSSSKIEVLPNQSLMRDENTEVHPTPYYGTGRRRTTPKNKSTLNRGKVRTTYNTNSQNIAHTLYRTHGLLLLVVAYISVIIVL